jgi:GT2 family glycosyltransferase
VLVDFIIVTWRSQDWIGRCISSIERANARHNYSVTVVDNASDDSTVAKVRERFPSVTVLANDSNRWLSPALNQGVGVGSAEVLVLMNPDCELMTDGWVDSVSAFMRSNPDVGLVGPRLLDEDGAVQFTGRADRTRLWALSQALYLPAFRTKLGFGRDWRWQPEWLRDSLRDVDVVSGACMVIRRDLLKALGGLDERFRLYYEEDDLCRRVRQEGARVVIWPGVEVMHAWAKSTSQMDPRVRAELADESFFIYCTKHFGSRFTTFLEGCRFVTDGARRVLHAVRQHPAGPA